ncbi:MAG: tetratricopeptide repeat protein [Nitrospirae bacterium]|nr:tetratricopeptide repeat protein [Nitrospirota bacterium]
MNIIFKKKSAIIISVLFYASISFGLENNGKEDKFLDELLDAGEKLTQGRNNNAIPKVIPKPEATEQTVSSDKQTKKVKGVRINTDFATLRSSPSFNSENNSWASKGYSYEVIDIKNEASGRKWYKIRTSSGKTWWLADKVVDVIDDYKPQYGDKNEVVSVSYKPVDEGKSIEMLLDQAGRLYSEGKCDEVITTYGKAINIAAAKKNNEMEAKLHYNIADCLSKTQKSQEAIKHLDQAISLSIGTGNLQIETLAALEKSKIFFITGDNNTANIVLNSVLAKADKEIFLNSAVPEYIKALISMQIGDLFLFLGKNDDAMSKLEYALMVNPDFKLEDDIINILKNKQVKGYKNISDIDRLLDEAWGYYEKGDYKRMGKTALQVLETTKRFSYKRGIFGGEYYLSMALLNMDDFDSATDHAIKAREFAESGNDNIRLGMVHNLTGNIFRQKKEYDKALYYYNKNLEIVRAAGNIEGEVVAMQNIGNVLTDKGSYRDALQYYEFSLNKSLESGSMRHLSAQAFMNSGKVLRLLGDYKKSELNLKSSLNIFRELDNEGGEIVCLWEIASVLAKTEQYNSAIDILETNLSRADKYGLKQSFIDDISAYAEKNKDFLKVEKYKKKEVKR